jgi:RNA polymerase sigma-70 factor (ECF subfamily)
LRSALALCHDPSEAEDLVQETFCQALESEWRFRGDSLLHTWLFGILRNVCHRYLRRKKRMILGEALVTRETTRLGPSLARDEADRPHALADAVRRLSPTHREVIVLRYYKNLSIHEIAKRTCVCEGTVKSRLHYAVHHLERSSRES